MVTQPSTDTSDATARALAAQNPLHGSVTGNVADPATAPAVSAATPAPDKTNNAVAAIAALTGKTPDEVRAAYDVNPSATQEQKDKAEALKKEISEGLKQAFPKNIDGELDQKAFADKLKAMSEEQRAAVTKFLQDSGWLLKEDGQTQGKKTPEEEAAETARAVARQSAQADMSPEDAMFAMFFRIIMQALGLGGMADQMLGSMGYGGNGGGLGTRSPSGAAKFATTAEIDAIVNAVPEKGTTNGVVNLANALVGQAETGNNGGAIVRSVMGYEGDPWCGGTVRFIFEKAGITGLYDQSDYRMAKSYMREGQEHGAFRGKNSGYVPKPGDVIVFDRGGASGHVGIVTEVKDGVVNYVAGNDGDAVSKRSYNVNNPPGAMIGVTDTQALAKAKGIDISPKAPAVAQAQEPQQTQNGGLQGTDVKEPQATPPATPPVPKATPYKEGGKMT